MSVSAWIDRLDDWINPIVVKELRQAVKSRLVTTVLLLFLGLQLFIVAMFLALQGARDGDPMNWHAGGDIFLVLQAILLGTCMVLIPTYASLRMSAERSETNVDLLFISTLRPTSIIAGKFFSAIVLAMLVYSCCAPFMTFTYLLRGIDIPSILFVLGIDLLAMILSTQLGLFLAAIPAPRAVKFLLFFLGFLMLCWIYAGLVASTSEMIRAGMFTERSGEFWAVMGVITLAVLFCTGLLFCWSVALISPPSANRALMGRLFLVGMWLILGAACLGLTYYLPWASAGPLATWSAFSVLFFCLQFLISINERDSWGPRVRRAIPRSLVLRPLAFLFYSGSAGGVLLSALCVGLTFLFGWIWHQNFTPVGFDELPVVQRIFGALALYVFCYGMSSELLRFYLLKDVVRTVFARLLLLFLLFGLGAAVPWILAFTFSVNRLNTYSGAPWWTMGNPFWSIPEIGRDRAGFESVVVYFSFLGIWALLLAALSVHWMGQQMGRFRPPAARVGSKAPVAKALAPQEAVLVTPIEAG